MKKLVQSFTPQHRIRTWVLLVESWKRYPLATAFYMCVRLCMWPCVRMYICASVCSLYTYLVFRHVRSITILLKLTYQHSKYMYAFSHMCTYFGSYYRQHRLTASAHGGNQEQHRHYRKTNLVVSLPVEITSPFRAPEPLEGNDPRRGETTAPATYLHNTYTHNTYLITPST